MDTVEVQVMATSFEVRLMDSSGEPSPVPDSEPTPLPARFQVRPDTETHPGMNWDFELYLTLDRVNEELEITHLDVGRPVSGPNVTSSTLREIDVSGALSACREACQPFATESTYPPGYEQEVSTGNRDQGQWRKVAVVHASAHLSGSLDSIRSVAGSSGFPPLYQKEDGTYYVEEGYTDRLRAAGPSSDETTRAVGWLYKFATKQGVPPVGFIQRTLAVPNATASHWVKLARQAGMVPASTRRPRSDRRNV